MTINPDLYHGQCFGGKDYFEGWYIKLTSTKGFSYSFILGICRGDDPHSFIQMADAQKNTLSYFRFAPKDFHSSRSVLRVKIENNNFTYHRLNLSLKNSDTQVLGSLNFTKITRWSDSCLLPGSMGIFNHCKSMECYSQVCILDGLVSGSLWIDGKKVDFTGGSVYMEKNWGKSFPQAWLWCQANNFADRRAAFSLSYAKVPFKGVTFNGLLSVLAVDGKLYKFTTMNTSKIKLRCFDNQLKGVLISPMYALSFRVVPGNFIDCAAPECGDMTGSVQESINSTLKVTLYNKCDRTVLYRGNATHAGLELGGLWSTTFEEKQ